MRLNRYLYPVCIGCEFCRISGVMPKKWCFGFCMLFQIGKMHLAANANFHVLGSKEWNRLPDLIKTATTKNSFKKLVKKYLKAQAHLTESNSFLYFSL